MSWGLAQCLKCRRPVKIIAMPCSLAAAMTSASPFEPPGLDDRRDAGLGDGVDPVAERERKRRTRRPRLRERSLAFSAAMCDESSRLICPAPTPTTAPPRANRIAFDFTCLQTFQANSRSRRSASVGLREVTTFQSACGSGWSSRSCTSIPPVTRRYSRAAGCGAVSAASLSSRTLFFHLGLVVSSSNAAGS